MAPIKMAAIVPSLSHITTFRAGRQRRGRTGELSSCTWPFHGRAKSFPEAPKWSSTYVSLARTHGLSHGYLNSQGNHFSILHNFQTRRGNDSIACYSSNSAHQGYILSLMKPCVNIHLYMYTHSHICLGHKIIEVLVPFLQLSETK